MEAELQTQTSAPKALPRPHRVMTGMLDSAASQALLRRHGITLSGVQLSMFRDIELTWEETVFHPDTAGCLVNGRFDQRAAEGYFYAVEKIWRLGSQATIEEIVQRLAQLPFEEGVAFVLYAAAKCILYSDDIAHEAYRQLMRSRQDKRKHYARAALKAYRTNLAIAEAALASATRR